jgi:hypothetical protein
MFVRYRLSAIDFAQADRQTKIECFVLPLGCRFRATHRGNDKSDIAAGGDTHRSNVEGGWLTRPRKKQVPSLLVSFGSVRLKWRRNIEYYDVGGVVLENPGKNPYDARRRPRTRPHCELPRCRPGHPSEVPPAIAKNCPRLAFGSSRPAVPAQQRWLNDIGHRPK